MNLPAINGIPVVTYGLIGLTTIVLAYITFQDNTQPSKEPEEEEPEEEEEEPEEEEPVADAPVESPVGAPEQSNQDTEIKKPFFGGKKQKKSKSSKKSKKNQKSKSKKSKKNQKSIK
jgi:flagellar biosynthesis component FlhA